jgi:2-polyprenyl-3-methyl-5-hydroxy-6-metoxy-1,4-benzoquinol methylase
MQRVVVPEILDDLAPDGPEAIRSRNDLRVLNRLIGGEAWIVSEISKLKGVKRVIDLGAGEGLLSAKIAQRMPEVEVLAVDLIGRPPGVPTAVQWIQQNVWFIVD